jgi:hypothetical protein
MTPVVSQKVLKQVTKLKLKTTVSVLTLSKESFNFARGKSRVHTLRRCDFWLVMLQTHSYDTFYCLSMWSCSGLNLKGALSSDIA